MVLDSPLDADDPNWPEIRQGVRDLCARFPGSYWRDKDRDRAYPGEFVDALTDAGYLACLIPEAYARQRSAAVGRRGDPGGDPQVRRQRRGLPCADVHHGHASPARLAGPAPGLPGRARAGHAAEYVRGILPPGGVTAKGCAQARGARGMLSVV